MCFGVHSLKHSRSAALLTTANCLTVIGLKLRWQRIVGVRGATLETITNPSVFTSHQQETSKILHELRQPLLHTGCIQIPIRIVQSVKQWCVSKSLATCNSTFIFQCCDASVLCYSWTRTAPRIAFVRKHVPRKCI